MFVVRFISFDVTFSCKYNALVQYQDRQDCNSAPHRRRRPAARAHDLRATTRSMNRAVTSSARNLRARLPIKEGK